MQHRSQVATYTELTIQIKSSNEIVVQIQVISNSVPLTSIIKSKTITKDHQLNPKPQTLTKADAINY